MNRLLSLNASSALFLTRAILFLVASLILLLVLNGIASFIASLFLITGLSSCLIRGAVLIASAISLQDRFLTRSVLFLFPELILFLFTHLIAGLFTRLITGLFLLTSLGSGLVLRAVLLSGAIRLQHCLLTCAILFLLSQLILLLFPNLITGLFTGLITCLFLFTCLGSGLELVGISVTKQGFQESFIFCISILTRTILFLIANPILLLFPRLGRLFFLVADAITIPIFVAITTIDNAFQNRFLGKLFLIPILLLQFLDKSLLVLSLFLLTCLLFLGRLG